MPAHSRQSERQNIMARRHTWQQCSVSTLEAILTTKYGFNLRQNSPLNNENNKGYSGWIRVSVAHALIGPQSLKLAHLWSDIRWFPPLLFRYIPLHDLKKAGETVLNATVPTSLPGDHSQVESPACGYCAKNRFSHFTLTETQNFSMWGMYDLSKAYRSMQKSIANRRGEDWEANNGHIKDTTRLFHGTWHVSVCEHICG